MAKNIFSALLFGSLATAVFAQPQYLLTGTYTGGKSRGIYVFRFDTDGRATAVDSVECPNPSFLAVSPNQQFVFAVNELGEAEGGGKISAYRFERSTGKLLFLNEQSSQGEHPCYVTVDKSGKWVIAGNYSSGNVVVLPVENEGRLGPAVTNVRHSGRGPHQRQEKPHVHATVLSDNNRFLYVPDLGIDRLMVYAFDEKNGSLTPGDNTVSMVAGSGPRHFTFHPKQDNAYLLQELSGEVTVFKNTNGLLQPVQTLSVLPPGYTQPFTSADIHVSPNGQYLYTSTRDQLNMLTIFSINPADGKLTLAGHQSTLGKTPRNFSFDPSGNHLLAANQNSDEVVVFRVNHKDGSLNDTGQRIAVGNPVCLQWIK